MSSASSAHAAASHASGPRRNSRDKNQRLPLHETGATGGINPWFIAITVTLATFMEVLDTSIANVALPHIAGSLAADYDESTWILTSYLVANAIVLPLSGWLSSIFGRKHFYMMCVALFTASSALCGLAPNLPMLIIFRILQGAGGGGLQPSEQSILADTFPPAKRGMAFAVYGFAVVAAPAMGPTLGGWITDTYSWRWVFYINVPIGLLSLALTSQIIKDPKYINEERRRNRKKGLKIDFIGLGLIGVGLGFLQVMLDKGQEDDWFGSHFIVACAIVATIGIAGGIIWEALHRDPMVDVHLFRNKNFALANLLMFMLGVVLLGSTVLIPEFTQELLGYTATKAGLVISPGAVVVMLLMPLVGFLLTHADARKVIVLGLVISSIGLWMMGHFTPNVDFKTVMIARIVQASGIAFLFIPINTASYAFLPPGKNNDASGLINLARNVGGSVGISLCQTIVARSSQRYQTYLVPHVTPYSAAFQHAVTNSSHYLASHGTALAVARKQAIGMIYNSVQHQADILAYVHTFRLMAIVFICCVPLPFLMKYSKPGAAQMH